MCKIILKFGEPLTKKEMEGHREGVERGAGIAVFHRGDFRMFKHLEHRPMFESYERAGLKSPFTLFHSRMPSAGSVNDGNIQPFADSRIAFCHNGTIDPKGLMMTALAKGARFTAEDSDSLLLFKLLRGAPISSAVATLQQFNQNFILVSSRFRRVYIIGRFDLEQGPEGYVKTAKNNWGRFFILAETNFAGQIIRLERAYEEPARTFPALIRRDVPRSIDHKLPSRPRFKIDENGQMILESEQGGI